MEPEVRFFGFAVAHTDNDSTGAARRCTPKSGALSGDEYRFIHRALEEYPSVRSAELSDGKLIVALHSANQWVCPVVPDVDGVPRVFRDMYDYLQNLRRRARLKTVENELELEVA